MDLVLLFHCSRTIASYSFRIIVAGFMLGRGVVRRSPSTFSL
jgi:hypothetical protein